MILFLIPLAWSTQLNANYFTAKSFLLYILGSLSFFTQAFQKNKKISLPSGGWFGLGLFFIILQIIYALGFGFPLSLYQLPKFFSLVGIVLFLAAIKFDLGDFFKRHEWWILGFFGVLLILTSRDLPGALIHPFGNVNMLAEFYLLSLPLIYFWIGQKSAIASSLKIVIFILMNVIILATKSRSACLGLGLWWGFWFYQNHLKHRSRFLVVAGLVLLLTAGIYIERLSSDYLAQKSASTTERLNFYRSTRDLILDRPLGNGFQFSTQIVPYRLNYPAGPSESEYPDQPHSEILKWGVQFGWLGFVMALFSLALIARRIAKGESFLLKSAGLVILPQILFQFPFENPATIILLALYIYLFAQSLPQKNISWLKTSKSICLLLGSGLFYFSLIFVISVYLESNFPDDLGKTAQACRMNPAYLRGCVRKNYNLLQAHQYADLKKNLKEDMRFNYYAADYLKLLSSLIAEHDLEPELIIQNESKTSVSVYDSAANQTKIFKKNCQILHLYVFMYKNQTHYTPDDIKACQNVEAPFDLKLAPFEFDRTYKNWIENLLK